MRSVIEVAVAAVLTISAASAQEVYSIDLDGAQVPNASSFTGSGTATLNNSETQLTVSVTHNIPNGNVTDGHIHRGAVGVNGPIALPFPGQGANPINEVIAVDAADVQDLRDGLFYVNIHTFAFPSGEIRGQLVRVPDTDQDLLLDIYETDTGTFVNETDTGTDPNNPDTDGDGVRDGVEVELGFDPNNALSFPLLPLQTSLVLAVVGSMIIGGSFIFYRRRSKT